MAARAHHRLRAGAATACLVVLAAGAVGCETGPRRGKGSPGAGAPASRPVAGAVDTGEFTPKYHTRWPEGLPSDPAFFPIGVWLQEPARERNGRANAFNYRDAGVNTFVGLVNFPTRADSSRRLATLKEAGMRVIAGGEGGAAADVRAIPAMAGADAVDGFLLGDEQDMSTDPRHITPAEVSAWARTLRAAEPNRPVYNNFGKAFSLYPWVGGHDDEAGLRAYCAEVDVVSSDYYAATDRYEPAGKHSPDHYGKAVERVRRLCGGAKPVWGFVETGHPGGDATWPPFSVNGVIEAPVIEQAVWSMLAAGANGVIYFVHDFFANGFTEDGVFDHPANLAVMTRVNAQLKANARILNAQRQPTGLRVEHAYATLRADPGGWYVVAAANSNAPATATFTLAAAAGRTVEVVDEGRTLTADASGRWSDRFVGWGHHLYRIAP